MSMTLDIAFSSFTGARSRNDDAVGYALPEPGKVTARGLVAAVADGVASTPRGWVAAQTTVRGLLEDFFSTPAAWEPSVGLDRILQSQNTWLHAHNHRQPDDAMETTLTAAVISGSRLTLAHVGDSRCYILRRNGVLQLLTEDHVRPAAGGVGLSPLLRSLGGDAVISVDYRHEVIEVGDVLILVTDGVWGVMRDQDLRDAVKTNATAKDVVQGICDRARQRGTKDNGSALVVRVCGLDADPFAEQCARASRLPLPGHPVAGRVLDGVRLVAEIGENNGVTRTWRAEAVADGKPLAFKTLLPGADEPMARRALLRESWLATSVHSPFVVCPAAPLAGPPSAFYTLTEWVEGVNLRTRVAHARELTVEAWLPLARGSLRAVAALHRVGIIHRDIKPENLVLTAGGRVCVLDLGAALTQSAELNAGMEILAGTPSYINPEQWEGAPATPGSDLYALGVTLFQLLTGALPYGEVLPYQTGRYVRPPRRVSLLRPDAPMWIVHWLERAVAARQEARFATAEEMLLWLETGERDGSGPAPEAIPLLLRNRLSTLRLLLCLSLIFNLGLLLALLVLAR